jgi:hypothetical protein
VGRCEAGQCKYDQIDDTCNAEWGCDATSGACKGDPCIGVSCQEPPNSCFLAQGLCQHGGCTYTAADAIQCDDGNPCTTNDTCTSGTCRGTRKECNTPPPPECADATNLRRYDASGVCNSQGLCYYAPVIIACSFKCETVNNEGRCKGDPCAPELKPATPNECNEVYCETGVGWKTRPVGGTPPACNTGSGRCPRGTCNAGVCLANSGASCTATVDTGPCSEMDVPGQCQGDGNCLPLQQPQNDQCAQRCGNNRLCVVCEPIPGFGFTLCL